MNKKKKNKESHFTITHRTVVEHFLRKGSVVGLDDVETVSVHILEGATHAREKVEVKEHAGKQEHFTNSTGVKMLLLL